mgnify:CR=1 FL=1
MPDGFCVAGFKTRRDLKAELAEAVSHAKDESAHGGSKREVAAVSAARSADAMAERVADKARAYNEAWRRGSDAAERMAEAREARTLIREACAQFRALRAEVGPGACDRFSRLSALIRSDVADALETIREARAAVAEAWGNTYGAEHESAFLEGADGADVLKFAGVR